jgi:hypothetical protein
MPPSWCRRPAHCASRRGQTDHGLARARTQGDAMTSATSLYRTITWVRRSTIPFWTLGWARTPAQSPGRGSVCAIFRESCLASFLCEMRPATFSEAAAAAQGLPWIGHNLRSTFGWPRGGKHVDECSRGPAEDGGNAHVFGVLILPAAMVLRTILSLRPCAIGGEALHW